MTSLDDDGSTQHDIAASGPAHTAASGPAHTAASGPAHTAASGPGNTAAFGPPRTPASGPGDTAASGPAHTPATTGHEPDPVRLSPPADPWMTEAPTSVVADPATLREFGATPAITAFHDTAGVRKRRPRRLLLVVLTVCAVFIAALWAVDRFSDDGDGALGTGPSARPSSTGASADTRSPSNGASPAPRPSTAATTTGERAPAPVDRPSGDATAVGGAAPGPADGPAVVYEVTASGSGNTGSVAYTDQDGQIIRRNGIALPWRTTFPAGSGRQPLVLTAQRLGGGDAGPVTCTITVGGKVLSTTTTEGRYGAPQCSG
ncbi:MmpS family transport accessory protein [Actinoplanes sp. CA-252034]|uniref:MmpS family transport accessory protein n=1 Tax=Actinoplanes sp. CA-252034 TaxID=3239906 RepID=UPI003D97BC0D